MPEQWTCDECGDIFHRREHHQRHLRTHTQEKPFACSVCGSSFGRLDSLARHHSSTHLHTAGGTTSSDNTERQRVSRACKRCSSAKVRCDGKRPCEKCVAADVECCYEPPRKRRTASQNALAEPQPKRHVAPAVTPALVEQQPAFMHPIDPQLCTMLPTGASAPDFMHADFFGAPKNITMDGDLSNVNWFPDGLDLGLWPVSFDLHSETQFMQDIRRAEVVLPQVHQEPPCFPKPCLPPTPPSDMVHLYSRSHSPVLDKDAVDVRQYHPTSIEVDAPLSLPEIDLPSLLQADLEDFAHVENFSHANVDALTRLIDQVQSKPHYPLYTNTKLPPPSVINAWVQLYFEYFHPVFPILHKATFSSPETHPLLVLTVAAIGAQFSNLPNSLACACSLHEMARRLASRQCEFQNKHGRTVWMTQVVMLNNLAMSHSGERRALEVAEILQALPVALARRKGVFEDVLPHERISQLQAPLQQTWQLWVMDEERRRTGFGVWLIDSTYRSNLNLTTVLNSRELKNSLPQSDERWNANSAQSWASYPPGLGSGRTKSLAEVIADDGWSSIWSKTSTLGKQVILQELMDLARPASSTSDPQIALSSHRAKAKQSLENLLLVLTEDQDTPVHELKALIAHKAICATSLLICSSPAIDLSKAAMSQIYNRMTDRDLCQIAQVWREAPYQGREAVFYAACVFETIRNNHTVHFSMPAFLLRAVLTLWLYSLLFDKPEVTGFAVEQEDAGSIALGAAHVNGDQVRDWIAHGRGRVKLPSIANLRYWQGRRKLLEHSTAAMGTLQSWGISKGYLQLLKRLEASEAAPVLS
ncbi:hypothetical protein K491DRAFT_723173 [Lophiostoma macrostomum CBS 122681]|uniref:C2H2 type zinc finger domain protein n=1 Tax=Lophiostoma macrostomum CBS 122681 TaxID=1314788 RepID=A0A6A6SNH4_9PLEO|nr:hypothetical protein K491DRAFT_723173 [Lophiostoma macrostomum CBS 122681]